MAGKLLVALHNAHIPVRDVRSADLEVRSVLVRLARAAEQLIAQATTATVGGREGGSLGLPLVS